MDGPPGSLRLLVFDAGDIRAISQLVILDEFLSRLESPKNPETRPHPCDYFHMMVGVGSSGIIVTFLMKLRMSVDEIIEEFINIWKVVFDDPSLDPAKRSQKLEEFMKELLRKRNVTEDLKFFENNPITDPCSAFICLGSPASPTFCRKIRTYRSSEKRLDITVIDAVRATCATPTFPVRVGSGPLRLEVFSGELAFSNPIREAIKEAHQHYGAHCKVSCVLSLGCGRSILTLEDAKQAHDIEESLSRNTAVACERIATEMELQIGISKVYHRFSVDRGLGFYEGTFLLPGQIVDRTHAYLADPKVSKEIDTCVRVSLGEGLCVLDDIYRSPSRVFSSTDGIPPLSSSFVMRKGLMEVIYTMLQSERRLVLSGMSGIGKTQVVSHFLRKLDSGHGPILFLDASSNRSIETGLVKRVSSFGVEYRCTNVKEALEKLAQPDEIIKNWIIVFDNVPAKVNIDVNLHQYFPAPENGVIIITTQNPFLGKLSPKAHIALDLMSEDESVEVLLKSADLNPTTENIVHAKAIVLELGYLPVAIVQAGYFIGIHRCIADYVERLRDNRPDILSRDANIQNNYHYHGIYTALNVTWAELSPHARRLMSLLAFIKYTGFPRTLLYIAGSSGFKYEPFDLLDRPPDFLQTVILLRETFPLKEPWNKQYVDDIVKELEQYSLIALVDNFSGITLRLHPLVHGFAYDRLEPHQRASYQAAMLRLLVCGSGEDNQDLYQFISPHIPPLNTVLAPIHANDLAGIARIFYYEGRISEATQLWKNIRDQVVAKHGEDHLRTSEATLQLAKMYWESDEGSRRIEARILEDLVVEFRLKTLPKDDPATARAMSQRARGLEYRNRLLEAEILRKDVLEIWKNISDPNSEEILQEKENLAQTYRLQKRWANAEKEWTEIWEVRKATKGSDHWRTLRVMESLANLYAIATSEGATESRTDVNTRQDKLAEKLWREVIATRTRTRGPLHPDTLYALQSLAWCFEMQQRADEAEKLWKSIFDYREKIQGAGHEATWQARNALAFFDYKHGRYDDAAAKWQKTVEASERVERTTSRQLAKAMESLARLYMKTGRKDDASNLLDKLKSMPPTRDHEIRTRYQRATDVLDPSHKHKPSRSAQPIRTGREAKKAGQTAVGGKPGYASRSDSSPHSSRQKTQSEPLTGSSRGTLIPSELVGLQHPAGYITDSPRHIRDIRSPEISYQSAQKTPEISTNILQPDLPTIMEPPDATSDGYFDKKPRTGDDESPDCHDEQVEEWINDRASMERLLLPNVLRGDQGDGVPRAPHPSPALIKDQSLPIPATVVTMAETDVQASCLQPVVFLVRRLVSKAKRIPLKIIRRKPRARTTKTVEASPLRWNRNLTQTGRGDFVEP